MAVARADSWVRAVTFAKQAALRVRLIVKQRRVAAYAAAVATVPTERPDAQVAMPDAPRALLGAQIAPLKHRSPALQSRRSA